MRKIERPDSTTLVLEFPFHLVKDEKELENILVDVDIEKQVKSLGRYMDHDNFCPHYIMWIDEDKAFTHSIKFVVRIDHFINVTQNKIVA
jgi:hypothetical protein